MKPTHCTELAATCTYERNRNQCDRSGNCLHLAHKYIEKHIIQSRQDRIVVFLYCKLDTVKYFVAFCVKLQT